MKLAGLLPAPDNPCGQVFFDRIENSDEDVLTTKVDYTISNSHSVFGRLLVSSYFAPSNYDGKTLMSPTTAASTDRAYSGVFGHTFLVSNNTVNGFRVTVNRGAHTKEYVPLVDYTDLGIKATPVLPDFFRMNVSGGFQLTPGLPTATPTWVYQVADDLSILRGEHQFGIGANYIRSRYDPQSYTSAAGNTTFTGGVDRPGPGRLHAGQSEHLHGRHADGCEDAIQLLRDVRSGQLARVAERDAECRHQVGSVPAGLQRTRPDYAFRSRAF